jgi:hypothetical protein
VNGFHSRGALENRIAMIVSFIISAHRSRLFALLLALLLASIVESASAQTGQDIRGQCWQKPAPETIEEIFKTSANPGARSRQAQESQREADNAILLISNGGLKVAYSAGLLVGWGETGDRPRFAAITGVGTGALIAPFAFIGRAGDQAIADIFNCDARNFREIAERAASLLDDSTLAAIAREHDAGRRLFIGVPGSAARTETVWNIGLLAKNRPQGALTLAKDILRAAVGPHIPVVPEETQKAVVQTFPSNPAFREPGSGQEFLFPPQRAPLAGARAQYFLIHNDRLFWDDSENYIRSRKPAGDGPAPALMPGSDIVRQVLAAKGSFRFASPKTATALVPDGEFDLTYLRALFRHAYRQGRMDKAWTGEFPGLRLSMSKP